MSHVLARPIFELAIRPDRRRVVVEVAGEIDLATVTQLEGAVGDLRAAGWQSITLDLRSVGFVDSEGLSWLLKVDAEARADDWELALVDGSPAVARLLELTRLRERFAWTRGL